MLFQEFDVDKYIEVREDEAVEKEKIEIAKNLLDILDDKTIAEKIGLPINEIIELRKSI